MPLELYIPPAAILIFNKGKKTNDVLFIDASREYQEGKNQNKLRTEDIKHIVTTYRERKPEPKYSHVAKTAEIQDNDFNLNIPRYVDTSVEEEIIDIKAVQKEIEDLEIKLTETRAEMNRHLKELGLI